MTIQRLAGIDRPGTTMVRSKSPKPTPTPVVGTKADPIAAIVCTVVFVLSALHVPAMLMLSAAQVTGIGSAVVLVAAAGRAIWHWRKGEEVSLQDPIAAALGGLVLVASLFGAPNAAQIDASTIAMVASSLTGLFTYLRGQRAKTSAA